MTATTGDAVDIIPSTQADDRPLRPKRCRQRTRASFCAISRTRDAVPSDELSSTKTISQQTFGRAALISDTISVILSRSLNVGTIIDNFGAHLECSSPIWAP